MYGVNRRATVGTICRDLESEAKNLHSKIKCNNEFITAIESFINSEYFYQVDERETSKSLFSLYGELKLKQPNLQKELDEILAEIEKQP